jgi:hypothetical protein
MDGKCTLCGTTIASRPTSEPKQDEVELARKWLATLPRIGGSKYSESTPTEIVTEQSLATYVRSRIAQARLEQAFHIENNFGVE